MLLSCFALIHSAAVAVLRPDSDGFQNEQMQIYQDSPDLSVASISSVPKQVPSVGARNRPGKLFCMYFAAHSESGAHMSLGKTEVTESEMKDFSSRFSERGWQSLMEGAKEEKIKFVYEKPCRAVVRVRRNKRTGAISPCRDVTKAFKVSASGAVRWLAKADELNGGSTFSDLTSDMTRRPHDIYLPIGHVEQRILGPEDEAVLKFTLCRVEFSPIDDKYPHRRYSRDSATEKLLAEWAKRLTAYLHFYSRVKREQISEIDELLKSHEFEFQEPSAESVANVYDLDAEQIAPLIEHAKKLLKEEKKLQKRKQEITAVFAESYMATFQKLSDTRYALDGFKLYQKLINEKTLRVMFSSVNRDLDPRQKIIACQQIAYGALSAYRSKRANDSFAQ